MQRQLNSLIAAALLLGFSSVAQAGGLDRLNMPDLPEYVLGADFSRGKAQTIEYVPKGQTAQKWSDKITLKSWEGSDAKLDRFQADVQAMWAKNCPNSQFSDLDMPQQGKNPLPSGAWMAFCPSNPATGQPEITMFRAIKGKSAFFVIQKAFKRIPTKNEVEKWVKYLAAAAPCESVTVEQGCDVSFGKR